MSRRIVSVSAQRTVYARQGHRPSRYGLWEYTILFDDGESECGRIEKGDYGIAVDYLERRILDANGGYGADVKGVSDYGVHWEESSRSLFPDEDVA